MLPLLLSSCKYRYVTGGVDVFFMQTNKHITLGYDIGVMFELTVENVVV